MLEHKTELNTNNTQVIIDKTYRPTTTASL